MPDRVAGAAHVAPVSAISQARVASSAVVTSMRKKTGVS